MIRRKKRKPGELAEEIRRAKEDVRASALVGELRRKLDVANESIERLEGDKYRRLDYEFENDRRIEHIEDRIRGLEAPRERTARPKHAADWPDYGSTYGSFSDCASLSRGGYTGTPTHDPSKELRDDTPDYVIPRVLVEYAHMCGIGIDSIVAAGVKSSGALQSGIGRCKHGTPVARGLEGFHTCEACRRELWGEADVEAFSITTEYDNMVGDIEAARERGIGLDGMVPKLCESPAPANRPCRVSTCPVHSASAMRDQPEA